MMKSLAIVILNFNTPHETIGLINDIKKQVWSSKVKIYIVDNASSDDSLEIFARLKTERNIEIIASKSNRGYAKGNNLGIQKAREDGFEWVVVSNSDIKFAEEPEFLEKIGRIYEQDKNIAVIAPNVVNPQGVSQNPFRKERFTAKELMKMKIFYLTGLYKIYYFLRIYIFFDFITFLARKKSEAVQNITHHKSKSGYIYAPHGSFLIFTPTFFKYFSGFDEGTFLYCEEFILAEMLRSKGLGCWYEASLRVAHQESKATEKIVRTYKEKVKFTLKHTLASCAYFVKILRMD
ncbi:glycosyltransferase family 2 protein [Sulfurimonas sp.]